MRRFILLIAILLPGIIFPQIIGGSFVPQVSRDITDGNWVDYENFLIYVAEGDSGLRVYESNAVTIMHLGTFTGLGTYKCVDVTGTIAYVAAGAGGLQIIDVSNPAAMTLLGSIANPDLRVLFHKGNYVYAGSFSKLFIYDVSNPAAITLVSESDLPGDPLRIIVDRNRLFAALGSSGGGLQVIDVSNPASPVFTTLFTYQGFTYDCIIDDVADAYQLFVAEGLRYHTYQISDQNIPPVFIRTDSVGGKVSRIAYPGYVVGKNGSTIQLYIYQHVIDSYFAPGASTFLIASGLEHIILCGDSLITLGILISGTEDEILPNDYDISEAYPNPFNPSTSFNITLNSRNRVVAEIISTNGEQLGLIMQEEMEQGTHTITLDGKGYSSGVYLVRFRITNLISKGTYEVLRKVTLLK